MTLYWTWHITLENLTRTWQNNTWHLTKTWQKLDQLDITWPTGHPMLSKATKPHWPQGNNNSTLMTMGVSLLKPGMNQCDQYLRNEDDPENWHKTEDNLTKAKIQKMTSNRWPTTNIMKKDNNFQLLLFTKDNQNLGQFWKTLDILEIFFDILKSLDNFEKVWTILKNFGHF